MDEYCECVSTESDLTQKKCIKMLDEISKKYAFDGESADCIISRMEKCNTLAK